MSAPESRSTIQVTVAGRSYRITTSVPEQELRRLANLVEERIEALSRGRQTVSDAAVVTAILFAHEAETAKARLEATRRETRQRIRATISRIEQLEQQAPTPPTDDRNTDD